MRAASRLRLWQKTGENRDSWDCCLEISGIVIETHTIHPLCAARRSATLVLSVTQCGMLRTAFIFR